jgi:hypothetical protein
MLELLNLLTPGMAWYGMVTPQKMENMINKKGLALAAMNIVGLRAATACPRVTE